jgi:hypothetical protein
LFEQVWFWAFWLIYEATAWFVILTLVDIWTVFDLLRMLRFLKLKMFKTYVNYAYDMFRKFWSFSLKLLLYCAVVLVKTTRSKNALFLLCQKGCLSPADIWAYYIWQHKAYIPCLSSWNARADYHYIFLIKNFQCHRSKLPSYSIKLSSELVHAGKSNSLISVGLNTSHFIYLPLCSLHQVSIMS